MTVVVAKAGIMAADSLAVFGENYNVTNVPKVEYRNGYLWGMRGSAVPSMAEVSDWLFDKEDVKPRRGRKYIFQKGYFKPFRFWDDRPKNEEDVAFNFHVMMLTPDSRVLDVASDGSIEEIPQGYHAIGSGEEYAIAIMDDRARRLGENEDVFTSIIDAVRAGIVRSPHCRAPIYWWKLDGSEGVIEG